MREKKKTIIRKKRDEEVSNEFALEAEAQGDLSHEEAVEASHIAEPEAKKDEGVSAPVLHGKKRVGKGTKKFEHPTDNNMSRTVEGGGDLDEGALELEDGEPELEE